MIPELDNQGPPRTPVESISGLKVKREERDFTTHSFSILDKNAANYMKYTMLLPVNYDRVPLERALADSPLQPIIGPISNTNNVHTHITTEEYEGIEQGTILATDISPRQHIHSFSIFLAFPPEYRPQFLEEEWNAPTHEYMNTVDHDQQAEIDVMDSRLNSYHRISNYLVNLLQGLHPDSDEMTTLFTFNKTRSGIILENNNFLTNFYIQLLGLVDINTTMQNTSRTALDSVDWQSFGNIVKAVARGPNGILGMQVRDLEKHVETIFDEATGLKKFRLTEQFKHSLKLEMDKQNKYSKHFQDLLERLRPFFKDVVIHTEKAGHRSAYRSQALRGFCKYY